MSEAPRPPDDDRLLGPFVLSDEHRMLLDVRDTLYDGSWESFARDLESRRKSEPHVFDTVPDSPAMLATIDNHLALIGEMRAWERQHGQVLRNDPSSECTSD